jgi:DNA polymerase elongation subunit (family B)
MNWKKQLRGNQKKIMKSNPSLNIRLIDWHECDERDVEEVEYTDKSGNMKIRKNITYEYVIRMFGITKTGTSITIHVTGFHPTFYVKVPEKWGTTLKQIEGKCRLLENEIHSVLTEKMWGKNIDPSFISCKLIKRKEFYGFTNNQLFPFLEFTFTNKRTMNKVVQLFKNIDDGFFNEFWTDKIYESNIPPFLRFIHDREIQPVMWIQLPKNKYSFSFGGSKTSRTQLDATIHWENVRSFECSDAAPFLITSFDIECDSHHGDFPQAKKDMKKTAAEITDVYEKMKCTKLEHNEQVTIVNEILYRGFYYDDTIPSHTLQCHLQDISKIFTRDDMKPHKNLIKQVAEKVVYFMNNQQNYDLLAIDIVRNLIQKDTIRSSGAIFISNQIEYIIEMAFTEEENEKKDDKVNYHIRKIFTRGNYKPSKKAFLACTSIIKNHSKKVIQQVYTRLKEEVCLDNIDIKDVFMEYEPVHQRKWNENKILTNPKTQGIYSYLDMCVSQIARVLEKYCPEIDNTRDTRIRKLVNIFPVLKEEVKETKPFYLEDTEEEEEYDDIMDQYDPKFHFPPIRGDPIIQIGTVVQRYGEKEPYLKHILTLNTCNPISGTIVEECQTEEEVIKRWAEFMTLLDPDIITGYNIFGFDFKYIQHRAEELNIESCLASIGRLKNKKSYLEEKKLSSSALGDNYLYYITTIGRVQMDLLKVIQRDHNLMSYKLDYIAEVFINDNVENIIEDKETNQQKIYIRSANTLIPGNYITFEYPNSDRDKEYVDKKFKIKEVRIETDDNRGWIVLEQTLSIDILFKDGNKKVKWQLVKDDVSPKQIFEFQKQGPDKRCIVATYCVQDCALCLTIINKLDIITNNIGMANVCYVPLAFIFLRGQGIKIFSLVSKQCKEEGFLLKVLKVEKEETNRRLKRNIKKLDEIKELSFIPSEEEDVSNEGGYEGAIVLKPHPDIYLEEAVTVLDYSSLYPSSMISENLSHDSYVIDQKWLGDNGKKALYELGYDVNDITYDVFEWINPNIKSKGKKKVGQKTCRFVSPLNGDKNVIPRILRKLLKARKDTRTKIKTEPDPFKKSVLDGFQLAYKQTANSLYGQLGAPTSPICIIDVAASTTAVGRSLLYLAKSKVEERFEGAKIVYGDTDSIFINFNPKDEHGNLLKNREALIRGIELGKEAEEYIQTFLKPPHKLEYEKTFWPFILFSKKRYVGHLYEEDPDSYKQKSMGIVLKRRDNADIVKHVYGGIINIIMNQRNIPRAIEFCKKECQNLLDGNIPLDMLIITKSLKGYYKNPLQIAHKVLADRMGERDPGNKPKSNDRIPYVYIEKDFKRGEAFLQGDKIEHPIYIREHSIKPDYKFYLTNQIMKPVGQIFALIVHELKGNKGKDFYKKKYKSLLDKNMGDEKKTLDKIRDLKHTEACDIIFGELIRVATNRREKKLEITDFFKRKQ